MAYCVKCGVKLGDSEKECPLCHTEVYHPDLPKPDGSSAPYPENQDSRGQKVKPKYKVLIASFIIFLPTILSIICDININSRIVWSDIVLGAVLTMYAIIFIPLIFHGKDAVMYLCVDFFAILLFQKYIEYVMDGNWFMGFSLPLTCSVMVIITAAILLKRVTKMNALLLSAIQFILVGFECVLVEFLINRCFGLRTHLIWSYYPAVTFVMLGLLLFICNRDHKLRNKIIKKFFI